ncbi:hypothetical protein LCGC14_1099370 [marine sediment metagenome]|uniref:Uncharacterized protein n=1 Tax=marine sediment metagenome TaxID=412755 RepID=A0A0F9PT20_9ZZZZ
MKKLIIILALLILPVQAEAWSRADTIFQLAYTTLHVVDWGQTRYVTKNYNRFHETNIVLGESPSIGQVNTYFLTTLIGHGIVSYFLPDKVVVFDLKFNPRRIWQTVSIGIEIKHVVNNFSVGVKMSF